MSRFNGLFTANGLNRMLKGKDYKMEHTVFPFIGEFIERTTEYKNALLLIVVLILSSDINTKYCSDFRKNHRSQAGALELKTKNRVVKKKIVNVFCTLDLKNNFILKFLLPINIVNRLFQFEDLDYIEKSLFQQFNYILKTIIGMTFISKASTLEKGVIAMIISRKP